ncbi:MAG: DNA primase [Cyanobacteria bacterium REEB65]|nr:DNA primase [Cyanobacteria bacterium REEB65]
MSGSLSGTRLMNGMDDKDRVRERADIHSVISHYVRLKKSGRGYTGLCPFHDERNPSFSVLPDRGTFKCFTCDKKGDVFTFVMLKEGVDFPRALEILAERFGVELTHERTAERDERRVMREAMAAAAQFYRQTLLAGEAGQEARQYAERRGLAGEVLEQFGIGAAPRAWDLLFRHLTAKGFRPETLEIVGLIVRGQQGWRDMFRGRLVFPICSEVGAVIGFGGRALSDEDRPKYLNSPESPLYQKSQHLFGLHLAKAAIKKNDRAMLVEGYMDVVTLHQYGFAETVGALGTALTPHQARSLLRYTESGRVVVGFDSDRAGQDAASRGVATLEEVARASHLALSVLAVPDGKDPDTFIRTHGAEAFAELLQSAPSMVEFQIDRVLAQHADLTTPEGRNAAIRKLLPIFASLETQARAEPYVHRVAARLGLNDVVLWLDIAPHLRYSGTPRYGTRAPAAGGNKAIGQQAPTEAERGLVYLMVENPEVRSLVSDRLGDVPFRSAELQRLRERLCSDDGSHLTWDYWLGQAGDEEEHGAIVDIQFEDPEAFAIKPLDQAEDFARTLLGAHWEAEASRLRQDLTRPDLDAAAAAQISRDLSDAIAKARDYKTQRSSRGLPAAQGS